MSATIRFPYPYKIPGVGPAPDSTQIITILPATGTLAKGGAAAYADVRPWKTVGTNGDESPYTCVVLEFFANQEATLGNGTTDLIGLYGEIDLTKTPTAANTRIRTLLGIVGVNIGNAMPQIPIVQQATADADIVGFSQVFSNIAAYDRLSIGGVLAAVALGGDVTLTVTGRPLRQRDYLG